ncbi:hypothetical protein Cylst_2288 [Cylindrospermum stagnale PCC 7417]|uniref:Uncharacterized protein n=1 Tax=Cylindrospermum stagnale PCC 7417 TaxID=56107 RepID=K9WWC2_9NOST|nr:hypothetical protein [Cylindrospermum stagnale]AFZ24518.1 hypothetical protein Cylst_2288 [Cylindrospermum stagnale PCC 7417]
MFNTDFNPVTVSKVARQKGEAEQERSKGEKDSGGILGWFADKAKAFFDGIKQAIQKAFEIARAAVKAAIDTAQKLATAVIETARQAIVSVIKRVGDALIALGDVLLAVTVWNFRDRLIKERSALSEQSILYLKLHNLLFGHFVNAGVLLIFKSSFFTFRQRKI